MFSIFFSMHPFLLYILFSSVRKRSYTKNITGITTYIQSKTNTKINEEININMNIFIYIICYKIKTL